MLRRSRRITDSPRVLHILKKGTSFKSRFFVLKALPNTHDFNRYGITISSKIEKSAVKRNYKRRQIYDILRQLKQEHEEDNYYDIIFLVRKPALTLTYHELKTEIQSLPIHRRFFGNLPDSSVPESR